MNAPQNDPRKASRFDFWRDEAKLPFLRPHERFKFYLAIVVAGFSGGGLVVSVSSLVANFEKILDQKLLISSLIVFAAYPVWGCIELFFKGGDAGKRLMDESDELRLKSADKLVPKRIASIYQSLKHDLNQIQERIKSRPGSGKAYELPQQQKEFDDQVRNAILEQVAKANKAITDIAPNHLLLPVNRLEAASEIHSIKDSLTHLFGQIDIAQENL